MLLRGNIANMMVRINPALYQEYVTYSTNGVPVLYVRLPKALYGMLRAAFLFYKRLQSALKDMGLKINPYNLCVANRMVDGGQITLCWHVDDLKISHRDETLVSEFKMALAKEFGPKTTISRGKVHNYLSIDLDFGTYPETMTNAMPRYLQKVMGYQGLSCGEQLVQGARR